MTSLPPGDRSFATYPSLVDRTVLITGGATGIGASLVQHFAAQGAKGFYEGAAAADMVASLRALGGLHTEEDFARGATVAEFVEPISIGWRGMEVFQCPPNGSGMHVLQMLGILGGMETPEHGPLSAERYHRHIEAARLVYRDRDAFLADAGAWLERAL